MLAKNKKGISEIVTTIIIILLAVVVFAVVSVVVKSNISKGAENIELASNCLEVEMRATKIVKAFAGNQIFDGYNVTVSRSGAGEKLNGVKLIVEDGENRVTSDDIIGEIKSLDKKTYFVSASGTPFTSAKVTVVPFFMKKSGDVYYCDESAQTNELSVGSQLPTTTSGSGGVGQLPVTQDESGAVLSGGIDTPQTSSLG